ncbi:hypothetical protein ARC20_00495 [Stenotrophomonas panacihumi]|uniref:Uncharacterized protein n=1 Tax=Stenotrophomonas panacihumi TaxID=676599 RepID=A0A0R0AKQ6_9GAMM|nr:hypothetical protein ARC20_00495 [Stenotrophomonas panacihumi]PTN55200.1 hypothetical protein C9J98_04960 [Stenotrophomonas panacihumi]
MWLGLLPLAFPLAAQQMVASDSPQQWQADTKANKQAQKAAEKAAEADAPPRRGGEGGQRPPEGAPPGGRGGPPPGGGEGGPPEGGMGGMGGGPGRGGPGGHGKHGGSKGGGGAGSPAEMLRPEMDFAAPLNDTLILYRSREAVVFGRKESSGVVILPLAGTPVEVAPGVQASLHEDAQGLRVEVATSNDIHVTYRYATDPEGALRVSVQAQGPVPRPGSRFEVERVYRRGR